MKKSQLIIQFFLVLLIFVIFAYFRFYNLDKRIGFEWDQEQFSNQIKAIVVNHKLTLLGPRVVSDKGFYLAPYFTYILIPFYLLTNLHPWALIYFLVFFNILFFVSAFFIIKKIFGFFQAIVFFLLWSSSSLMAGFDVGGWWPVTIPLGVILTWFVLYQLFKNNSFANWLILGLVLGFFVNMHFQFIFLVIFSLFFLILSFINKKSFNLKRIVLTLSGFLLMFIPLLIFDLRHDFLNSKAFINFFLSKDAAIGNDPNVWFTVFTYFIQSIIFFRLTITTIIFYLVMFTLTIYLYKTKKNFFKSFYMATLLLWLTFPLFFALYGKRPSEYYFIFLMPFIFIVIVDFFFTIKKPYLLFLYFLFFFSINIKTIIFNLRTNPIGLYPKDKAVRKLKELTLNKKFNISLDTPLGLNSGYRYLFDLYQIKQTGDWKDPLVEIRVPPKKDDIVIQGIGIKIPKELK